MELFVAVLTLLVAVLAVTPRERQLDLQVRFRAFDWAVLIAAAIFVIGFEFYELVQVQVPGLPPAQCWRWGMTPAKAAYVVILLAVLILSTDLYFAKLRRSKMAVFRELIEELYWNENFGALFALLKTHLDSLFGIYRSQRFLVGLQEKLNPISRTNFDEILGELAKAKGQPVTPRQQGRGGRLRRSVARALRISKWIPTWRIARFLPQTDESQESARELVHGIFLTPQFLTALAQTRPYLGLDIIKAWNRTHERADFVDLFFRQLLSDPNSILFREAQNNQNLSGDRYRLPASNRILHYLFEDVKVAQELGIYKPIGDFLMSHVDDLARRPLEDPHNKENTDFTKYDAWRSPLFVGIRLFDIMVKEALFQGVEWHMWLYYVPHLVEGVVRNYCLTDPLVDPSYEFPTRYGAILYEAFSNMRDWILAVEDLPDDQANVVLKSTTASYDENGNIPKCSIKAIARSLYSVIQSENVGPRTKKSLAVMVLDIYFDLRERKETERYAQVLLDALAKEGSYSAGYQQYRGRLAMLFEGEKDEFLIKREEAFVADVEARLGGQSSDF